MSPLHWTPVCVRLQGQVGGNSPRTLTVEIQDAESFRTLGEIELTGEQIFDVLAGGSATVSGRRRVVPTEVGAAPEE
jgi:hypothetical protein